jgi:hypothetical protein
LPVPLEEKVEILVILSSDPDEGIRNTAFYTLETWNLEELCQVLSNPQTPVPLLDFAATQLVPKRRELAPALLDNPGLPQDLRDWVRLNTEHFAEEKVTAAPAAPAGEASEAEVEIKDPGRETLIQKLNRMSAADKIKTALTGSQEERLILIRDANKTVARTVLQSPKLSDQEIEAYASMKSVTEEILRLIAMNRKFMKSYAVARALVNNSRTPIDVSLPLLNRLNERDMKGVSINKNVPEVIRGLAAKTIRLREEATKPKLPGKK